MPVAHEALPSGHPPQAVERAERVDTHEIARAAGRGAAWQVGGSVLSTIITIGASTILARHLTPADFGLFTLAVLARDFIERLAALGMGAGIIAKPHVTEDDLSTAFWTTAAVKVALFAAAFGVAPSVAAFFRAPELTWVLRALCLGLLLVAASTVPSAILQKRMHFGNLVVIDTIGTLIASGLAVILAVATDLRHWALVIGTLASGLFIHAAICIAARWRPGMRFNRDSFRFQFRFGAYGLAGSLLGFLNYNVDYILLGRLLGTTSLGLYEFAYKVPHIIHNRITRTTDAVLFPGLSQAKGKKDVIARGMLKATRVGATITWPLLAGLAAVAYPAVALLWGERWLEVVPALRILCLAAALNSIQGPVTATLMACCRPDMPFKLTVGRLAITVALVMTLGMLFGLLGVAVAMALASAFYFYAAYWAARTVEVAYLRVLRALIAPACIALATGVGSLAATSVCAAAGLPVAIGLTAGILGGASCCAAMIWLGFRDTMHELVDILRMSLKRSPRRAGVLAPAAIESRPAGQE